MNLLNAYLSFLQEREWNEPDNFDDFLKVKKYVKLMKDLDGSAEINDEKHDTQPTLVGLMMTSGGDYKGRKDMTNAKSEPHTGLKKLKKYLPKDWETKLRKSLGVDIKL